MGMRVSDANNRIRNAVAGSHWLPALPRKSTSYSYTRRARIKRADRRLVLAWSGPDPGSTRVADPDDENRTRQERSRESLRDGDSGGRAARRSGRCRAAGTPMAPPAD